MTMKSICDLLHIIFAITYSIKLVIQFYYPSVTKNYTEVFTIHIIKYAII